MAGNNPAREKTILGPITEVRTSDTNSYKIDPFRTSYLDYQRRFSDTLSKVVLLLIQKVCDWYKPRCKGCRVCKRCNNCFRECTCTKSKKGKKVKCTCPRIRDLDGTLYLPTTEEGKKKACTHDIYAQLECVKNRYKIFAEFLSIVDDDIKDMATELRTVRNQLAHQSYLLSDATDTRSRQRTKEFTLTFIDFGIEFATVVQETISNREERWKFEAVYAFKDNFDDLSKYSSRSKYKFDEVKDMDVSTKQQRAHNVLESITTLINQQDHEVTEFVITSLAARIPSTDH